MSTAHRYNHFVPAFTLRNFSVLKSKGKRDWREITIYNYRNNSITTKDIKRIFGAKKFFWDQREQDKTVVEKEMNHKIEQDVSILFKKIIHCEEDFIELSRKEIDLIRKFFLLTLIRLPSKPTKEKGWEKHFENFWNRFSNIEIEKIVGKTLTKIYPDREFKLQAKQKGNNAILDDIKIILNNEFQNIIENENCSVNLARKFIHAEISDIGIWKAGDQDDFIISDTYLTNEGDHLLKDYDHAIMKNSLYLKELIERYEHDEELVNRIQKRLDYQEIFHENIWFMPISPKHVIVFVNPLYRDMMTDFSTIAIDYDYFQWIPNLYLRPVSTRDTASNNYEIQNIDKFVTRYINTLIMDRVKVFFGFKDVNKIISSVELYQSFYRMQFGIMNYEKLLKRLKEEGQST